MGSWNAVEQTRKSESNYGHRNHVTAGVPRSHLWSTAMCLSENNPCSLLQFTVRRVTLQFVRAAVVECSEPSHTTGNETSTHVALIECPNLVATN